MIRVTTLDNPKRRRTKVLAILLVSVLVSVCCLSKICGAQDSFRTPQMTRVDSVSQGKLSLQKASLVEASDQDSGQLVEADSFTSYNRLPPPMGPDPNVPAATGVPVSATQVRPEFPGSQTLPKPSTPMTVINGSPTLNGANDATPMLLDWNLAEPSLSFSLNDSRIQAAEPIAIIPALEPLTECADCGSSRLHSASLSQGQRLSSGLFAALCPCDDCYQPKWDLQQSAAFFVDSARPQTRTRFGWDFGADMMLADRAEYFWARSGTLGPNVVPEFNYHELSMYTEVAKGGFSFFTSLPYRSLYLREEGHEAGFADIKIGTKSLVHDSPLLQIAFQMTTHIPSAQSIKGLGTAHVSLEPALLFGMRLSRKSFLQAQVAQWIPIGGDPDYAGSLARWGISWNRLAWQLDESTQMTTNLEVFAWSFQDGAYTDPVRGALQKASNETYVYLGPGCRLLVCNKWEIGVGGAFALSDRHFAETLIRSEFTMRF